MGSINTYRDLIAWQRAYSLGVSMYRCTTAWPESERYCLTAQVRRSAVSIASNIAEGFGRGSTKDYVRFLKVARGSLYELDTQLQFARDLGFVGTPAYDETKTLLDETERVLAGLIRSLQKRSG